MNSEDTASSESEEDEPMWVLQRGGRGRGRGVRGVVLGDLSLVY